MANQRLSAEKRAFIIGALAEGTPINACCRMLKVGKHAVLRVIRETGEALNAHMREKFRELSCARLELDEQWQYVGMHGQRMTTKEAARGDFWLWAAIDPDTKLVVTHMVDRRKAYAAEMFAADLARRVRKPVQIATDNLQSYPFAIRGAFGYEGFSYGTETKVFADSEAWKLGADAHKRRMNGVPKTVSAERKAVLGSPDLGTITTSHIERVFLSVRQELARFTRCTLAYSKDLQMHKLAVAMHFGIYNLARKHTSLGGKTPAQAAGVEDRRWTLEDIVEFTEAYWAPKREKEQQAKASAKRKAEDEVFYAALRAQNSIT